jgi:hypothetical protein
MKLIRIMSGIVANVRALGRCSGKALIYRDVRMTRRARTTDSGRIYFSENSALTPVFLPLLKADYGSATFAATDIPALYEVRVSTTGLLIRKRGP